MLLRLRPVVHATPTPTGLHVRGWTSSFTVEGGSGLWRLWEHLSVLLAEGVPAAELEAPAGLPEPVARALGLIIVQLREHDMLVEVPPGWGQPGPGLPPARVAAWLESAAANPAVAWERLSKAAYSVHGNAPLTAAATRALKAAGAKSLNTAPETAGGTVSSTVGGAGDGVVLSAAVVGEDPVTVVAGCLGEVGYAVAPRPPGEAVAEAAGVRLRLLLGADGLLAAQVAGDGAHRAIAATAESPEVLHALVGGAAAHRLLCAVAGMPDPVEEAAARTPEGAGGDLSVMIAKVEPLGITHHSWPSRHRSYADPWEGAAAMLEVLGDPELGLVPPPEAGELPQLPVSLAACGPAVGFGTTLESARLHAALSAVRSALPAGTVVGADVLHARGIGLREAVHRDLAGLPGTPVGEADWAADPAARRWWKALTLRFAVPATVEVVRIAEGVTHARVSAGGRTLAWAVEPDAGTAAAFALLAATAAAQARAAGRELADPVVPCGAAPVWLPPQDTPVPWETRHWFWPAGTRDGEERFQLALDALTPGAEPAPLGPLLSAAGLAAVTVAPVRAGSLR